MSPFGWSTPAPLAGGAVPAPWRVAHSDRALALVQSMTSEAAYVTHDDAYHGRLTLWVGLRDNRDRAAHAMRLRSLGERLAAAGHRACFVERGGRAELYLVDDEMAAARLEAAS